MYEPWFPLNLHEKSYLDVFPKEQLVYLTPHCRDVMKEFDHNAVYIIGAIVDKVNLNGLCSVLLYIIVFRFRLIMNPFH